MSLCLPNAEVSLKTFVEACTFVLVAIPAYEDAVFVAHSTENGVGFIKYYGELNMFNN